MNYWPGYNENINLFEIVFIVCLQYIIYCHARVMDCLYFFR